MIKSIKELRNWIHILYLPNDGKMKSQGLSIANKIEEEVRSYYQPVPVDADGVPIFCGDIVDNDSGHLGKVQHIEVWPDEVVIVFEHSLGQFTRCSPDSIRHATKQSMIEDVLLDFANEVSLQGHQIGLTVNSLSKCYADKICKLINLKNNY